MAKFPELSANTTNSRKHSLDEARPISSINVTGEAYTYEQMLSIVQKQMKHMIKLLPPENYTPQSIRNTMTEAEMRKEYTRLRGAARKRLIRMSTSEYNETEAYKQNKDKYIPLSQIKSKTELIYKISEVSNFLRAKSGSVLGNTEIMYKSILSLKSHGYKEIEKENFVQFGEFMKRSKELGILMEYDSERVVEMYQRAKEVGMDPMEVFSSGPSSDLSENFNYWVERKDELTYVKNELKSKNEKPSAKDYVNAFKKMESFKE